MMLLPVLILNFIFLASGFHSLKFEHNPSEDLHQHQTFIRAAQKIEPNQGHAFLRNDQSNSSLYDVDVSKRGKSYSAYLASVKDRNGHSVVLKELYGTEDSKIPGTFQLWSYYYSYSNEGMTWEEGNAACKSLENGALLWIAHNWEYSTLEDNLWWWFKDTRATFWVGASWNVEKDAYSWVETGEDMPECPTDEETTTAPVTTTPVPTSEDRIALVVGNKWNKGIKFVTENYQQRHAVLCKQPYNGEIIPRPEKMCTCPCPE